ncbi:DeoR/GlpR family DNA-binding transcription regulator [Thioclava nitratireducens]|uniref:DeoR/GlpR family DNA-binding transcription regulator n=1 Tax=Thioclava nitratireducens TaxID=1915078 RepID=UPI00248155FE|nr:DeoR/GlpR family DNA-binding transcription regulator [Thioclava nitratireducens]WGT49413.1 DeoR/GlpR family DNA-binding transcription regulator [Thioclava nitratireducens]
MTRPSRQQERIDQITALLDVSPALRLRDLSEQMGVTEMTLRRDAAQPEAGFACRGGYIVTTRTTEHYDFDAQMNRAIDAKRAAAGHALDLVPEGAVVFLDTGTTLPHLARLLAQGKARRIITHCLTTAEILQGRSSVPVEFLGGEIKSSTRSCHAGNPQERLAPLGIDVAFLSAGGVGSDGALSCSHEYEVPLKRAAIEASKQCFVVVDASKIGQRKPVVFATLDEISGIVTEAGLLAGMSFTL